MSASVATPRPYLQQHFLRIFEQTARLCEADLPPDRFHAEFLQGAMSGMGAVAGVMWGREPGRSIRCEFQVNLQELGLDKGHPVHDELLRQAFRDAQPMALGPHSGPGGVDAEQTYGNPTDHVCFVVPVAVEKDIVGVIEVWLEQPGDAEVQTAYLQFLVGMAHYASIAARNRRLRTMAGQQDLWTRLESFSRQVHASLNLEEVAHVAANEGRQLVGCDRISVAGRRGWRAPMEAISGVDTIDRRSAQARLLSALCGEVMTWGETLVYRGTADDSLPPAVATALDAYLAVSHCQVLVVQPLRDDAKQRPARFALVLEHFEPAADGEVLIARLEVLGRHALSALENAGQYRRIPLRWLWTPLASIQDSLGGPRGAWGAIATVTALGVGAALVGLPFPLKMSATGQLLPRERRCVYSPVEGQVIRFEQGIQPGVTVSENQPLVLLHDTQLELRIVQLTNEVAAATEDIAGLAAQHNAARTESERVGYAAEKKQKEFTRERKLAELRAVKERTCADDARPGYFWLKAPLGGTVLNWDFRERFTNRFVKPSEPLLRVGDKGRGWEVELKIPHKHLGQVLEAYAGRLDAELDIDLLLVSAPTRTFTGKLARRHVAVEASPDTDGPDSAPVVRASVRIDGADIPEAERLPRELLVTGTEVHAKVRCGTSRAGYAMFYGVWEFLYEKVLFW